MEKQKKKSGDTSIKSQIDKFSNGELVPVIVLSYKWYNPIINWQMFKFVSKVWRKMSLEEPLCINSIMTVNLKKLKYKSTPISETSPNVLPLVLWINMNQTQTLSLSGRQAQWTNLLFLLKIVNHDHSQLKTPFLKLSSRVMKIII